MLQIEVIGKYSQKGVRLCAWGFLLFRRISSFWGRNIRSTLKLTLSDGNHNPINNADQVGFFESQGIDCFFVLKLQSTRSGF